MRMIVASRIFGVTIDKVKTDAFVPLADMLNHKRPRETTWYYSDNLQGFVIESCEDIPRGSPVHDSYGKKCNSRFFLNYGFINVPNDGNEVPLKLALDEQRPHHQAKLALVNGRHACQWFRVVDNLTDAGMLEMLSWARFIVFEDEGPTHLYIAKNEKVLEVRKKREERKKEDSEEDSDDALDLADVFKGHNVKPYNIQNECAAWQLLKDAAIEAAGRYPQTLEEDVELLKSEDLTMNQRNCVLFRLGEKELFRFLVDCADLMQTLLKQPLKEARATAAAFKHFHVCDSYVKNAIYPLINTAE